MTTHPKWIDELVTQSGLKIGVRPAHPDDEAALARFFEGVTSEDRRFRFLSSVKLGHEGLAAMTDVDHRQTESFLVFEAASGNLVATAMLACDPALTVGEVAISVSSDFKNRGIGWEMLGYLGRCAKAKGVTRLQSLENRANKTAIQIEQEYGFSASPYEGDSTLVLLQRTLSD